MKKAKKFFMRMVLITEMTAFGYLYFFGNNGIVVLRNNRDMVVGLEKDISQLKDEVSRLEQEIYAWETDDFYKEKVAREQLQMARKGDELFYIGA
jgi:cell division protein FtsB